MGAFVVDDERAHRRTVKVARRSNLEAMVEDGLKPIERVVVYPSDALKEGSRVEIRSPR
jgi:HlyD family secretion protein